jgi:hypothetical protein
MIEQSRYGRYSQRGLPRDKRTIAVYGEKDDTGKWYRCWNCGSLVKVDRNPPKTGSMDKGGSNPLSTLSLLLHMDGTNGATTFTDSSPDYGHTVTASGDVNTSTAQYKFATASALFDGTGDYLTVADHAAFDLSGGYWTIDFWVRGTLSGTGTEGVYFQRTDANNYFQVAIVKATSGNSVALSIYASGSEVVTLSTEACLTASTWSHVEVSEYLNNYRIFVDGKLMAIKEDSSRPADYTGTIYLGCTAAAGTATNLFAGYLDELRVIKTAQHFDRSFDVPTEEYDAADAYISGAYEPNVTSGCPFCGCTNYR